MTVCYIDFSRLWSYIEFDIFRIFIVGIRTIDQIDSV